MSRSPEMLISELSRGLQPVRRAARLRNVAALAVALALGAGVVAVLSWSLNEAFQGLRPAPRYWVAIAGMLAFAAGGVTAALASSIPGNDRLVRAGVVCMAAGAVLTVVSSALFLLMISDGAPGGTFWSMLSLTCLGKSSLVAVPAAILLAVFAARGYPHRPGLTVGFGALGGVAFGSLPVAMSCGAESIFHIVFGHLLAPASAGVVLWGVLWLAYRLMNRAPRTSS